LLYQGNKLFYITVTDTVVVTVDRTLQNTFTETSFRRFVTFYISALKIFLLTYLRVLFISSIYWLWCHKVAHGTQLQLDPQLILETWLLLKHLT